MLSSMQPHTLTGRTSFRGRQKDPEKSPNLDSTTAWAEINQCYPEAIEKVIRPKILDLDANGCERILTRLRYDRALDNL